MHTQRVKKDSPVLVIGAGAAGLSVAHRLASRGFRRVTVLESSDRVGGKCWSVSVRGRSYEMGAIGFPGRRNTFLRLADSRRIRPTATWSYAYATPRGSQSLPVGLSLGTPWQALRLGKRLARLQGPGFVSIDPSLAVPMGRWVEDRKLHAIADSIRPLITGLGYGFYRDIAAAYALKHTALFRPDVYQLLEGGSQAVWEGISKDLDVRRDHRVERVERRHDGVRVQTTRGAFEARSLIVATPPKQAAAFLDASDAERRLLGRFKCFRYHAMLCDVSGFPDAHYGFFPDAYDKLEPGRPVALSRREPGSSTSVVYSYLDPDAPEDHGAIVEANQRHLRTLGARIETVHRQHTWDYFPHVDPGAIASGFFSEFDRLQGGASTFYVGEALAYPTVRHVVEHAFHIVDRFFA